MVMSFKIKHQKGASLGNSEEVIDHLSNAFPETTFELVRKQPLREVQIRESLPIYLRLFDRLSSLRAIGYPQYRGSSDYGIEFCFAASDQVKLIETQCWGINKERELIFEKLFEDNDWRPQMW